MLKKIMKKANEKKNQKGFTLIELLAVIVILAILAAIAIPSVVSIINKQNDKAAVQDGLTIIHAAKLYVADNGDATDISKEQLDKYIDNSNLPSDADYSVSKANKIYTLTYNKLPSDVGTEATGGGRSATEQQLLTYNGKSVSSTTEPSEDGEPG